MVVLLSYWHWIEESSLKKTLYFLIYAPLANTNDSSYNLVFLLVSLQLSLHDWEHRRMLYEMVEIKTIFNDVSSSVRHYLQSILFALCFFTSSDSLSLLCIACTSRILDLSSFNLYIYNIKIRCCLLTSTVNCFVLVCVLFVCCENCLAVCGLEWISEVRNRKCIKKRWNKKKIWKRMKSGNCWSGRFGKVDRLIYNKQRNGVTVKDHQLCFRLRLNWLSR